MISLIARLDKLLHGWPDASLDAALMVTAAALMLVAFLAPPAFKAAALAWVWLP